LTFYVKIWRYIALNLQISTLNLLVKPLALSSSNFNPIAVLNKSLQALGLVLLKLQIYGYFY